MVKLKVQRSIFKFTIFILIAAISVNNEVFMDEFYRPTKSKQHSFTLKNNRSNSC